MRVGVGSTCCPPPYCLPEQLRNCPKCHLDVATDRGFLYTGVLDSAYSEFKVSFGVGFSGSMPILVMEVQNTMKCYYAKTDLEFGMVGVENTRCKKHGRLSHLNASFGRAVNQVRNSLSTQHLRSRVCIGSKLYLDQCN